MDVQQILTVICEGCGHRNRIARPVEPSEVVVIICHNCEASLLCEADSADEVAQALSLLWGTDE